MGDTVPDTLWLGGMRHFSSSSRRLTVCIRGSFNTIKIPELFDVEQGNAKMHMYTHGYMIPMIFNPSSFSSCDLSLNAPMCYTEMRGTVCELMSK